MLRALRSSEDQGWLGAFAKDFHRRFLSLLSYQFREFPSILALSIDESANAGARLDAPSRAAPLTKPDLDTSLTPFDHRRLESYANNLLDYVGWPSRPLPLQWPKAVRAAWNSRLLT